MPETGNNESREQNTRTGRGLKFLVTVLVLALAPVFFYAFHIFQQLDQVREHQLRRLDSTARAAEELLANARTNVASLSRNSSRLYACDFFERQARLRLEESQRCDGLARNDEFDAVLQQTNDRLWVVARRRDDSTTLFRVEVLLHALLEENPFGDAFEQLFVVNGQGARIGEAITPRRSSPMLPPGVTVPASATPVRTPNLAQLRFAAAGESGATEFSNLPHVTFAHPVELAGKRYTLMCHPWSAELIEADRARMWLCGLTDASRSLRQALQVSPELLVLMLVLLTVAVVNWPILKVLSLAPQERMRFVDLYMNALATLALVMLLTVGIAYVGTNRALEDRSAERLQRLATGIETSLRAELHDMYLELDRYDETIEQQVGPELAQDPGAPALIGCLLLPPEERADAQCQATAASALTLPRPEIYPYLQLIFWMQPCEGSQTIKGATRAHNTPAVRLHEREYFRAVMRQRLWPLTALEPPRGSEHAEELVPAAAAGAREEAVAAATATDGETLREGFFVETSASITTGEFFAALSIPSRLRHAPAVATESENEILCALGEERDRYAAALTGQPLSVRAPVLAPGVAFAIADRNGSVLFHSDERRAVFENLFEDDGIARRLRAALATRAEADFVASYRTRPHQVHVRPMAALPWSVITFADREVLRTFWAELLTRTGVLLAVFLALAFLGTCLYMLVHGRQPPVWMWPRREQRYRRIYAVTIAGLAAQLVTFVLALALLHGEILVLACVLLPLPALGTVVVAGRTAEALEAAARAAGAPLTEPFGWDRAHLLRTSLLVLLSVLLLLALLLAMNGLDAVAAAHSPVAPTSATSVVVAMLGVFFACAVAVAVVPDAWLRTAGNESRADSSPESRPHGARGQAGRLSRLWRHPLAPHITGTMCFWILIGALPAYGLFKFSLAREVTVLTKAEQSYTARALSWHACRMQDDLRVLPGANGDARITARISGYGGERATASVRTTPALPPYAGLYPEALLSRVTEVTGRWRGKHDRSVAAPVWAALARRAPIYNEATTHTRYLAPFVSADGESDQGRWLWRLPEESAEAPVLAYQRAVLDDCDDFVPALLTNRPAIDGLRFGWPGLLAAVLALALLFAWVTYAARKFFFGEIEDDIVPGDADSAARHTVALEPHLEHLDRPPDRAWARAEVAAIEHAVSLPDLEYWCDTCATRRAVLDRILERAKDHYEQLWNDRTEEQKLLLVQLVEEGFANPKQAEAVRALLRDGLLRRDPILRPMNHSFAVFVERSATPALVRQEHVHHGLRWSLVRNVLLGALLLVFVFLAVTQREAMQVLIASLGAAAAAATGVLKLMGFMSRASLQKNAEL